MSPALREPVRWSVVIPTVGRPSLADALAPLVTVGPDGPDEVVVVDDRPRSDGRSLPALDLPTVAVPVRVLRSGGRGPAAARNTGWRATAGDWVAFLDDDVVPPEGWCHALVGDLGDLDGAIAASQGRIVVPLPSDRRPTDWQRNTAGLEHACWATADMAYRREVLAEVGGFDERFGRAFREDADLGLRVCAAGYLIVRGDRHVTHPVRPAGPWVSVRSQRGNADDVVMGALHGPAWRVRCGAEPGRNATHLATTAAAVVAGVAALRGRRAAAAVAGGTWAVLTARFAGDRIAPGPRSAPEVATMAATSVAIPPVAMWHSLAGRARLGRTLADTDRAPLGQARPPLAASGRNVARPGLLTRPGPADPTWKPSAILFDRDATLIIDVPYNTDPDRVALMPGARMAVARARAAGVKVGVVTNQSGVARGLVTDAQLAAVNARVEALLGPFDTWAVCPHGPDDGCGCRKPAPGLVVAAADALGVPVAGCVVVGDIGSDVAAAGAAGARSVLVPTVVTRRAEVAAAAVVAPDILRAVDFALAGTC